MHKNTCKWFKATNDMYGNHYEKHCVESDGRKQKNWDGHPKGYKGCPARPGYERYCPYYKKDDGGPFPPGFLIE